MIKQQGKYARLMLVAALLALMVVLAGCPGPAVVPAVTRVTIDQLDQSIVVGGTFTFTAAVVAVGGADPSVTWSSDNEAAATVDATGLVTGVAVGTANITATSVFDTTRFDTVTVTVTAPVPAVTSVTINEGDGAIALPFAFTVTVAAVGEADESVTWSSDNPAVTVESATGAVTIATVGELATITATSVLNPAQSDTVQVFVADVVVTNGNDDDSGSLRQVYGAAAPGSVIGFAPGVNEVVFTTVQFIPFHDAHLIIDNVTISGLPRERVVLSGDATLPTVPVIPPDFTGRSRVLMTTGTVTLQNLTIQNGANIVHGAGIRNAGTLTLDNVTVEDNVAFFDDPADILPGLWGFGGGIDNTAGGTLIITNSIIRNNEAGVGGGIANGRGGMGTAAGVVTITDSTISGNSAEFSGGGLSNFFPGTMTLNNVTVQGNTADDPVQTNFGGGIFTGGGALPADLNEPDRARLVIIGGLIDGNTSEYGGGIAVGRNGFLQVNPGPTTVSNNQATGGSGGGLIVFSRTSTNLNYSGVHTNVTFSGNTPDDHYLVGADFGPTAIGGLPTPEEAMPQFDR